jgi:hypothetical protein
MLLAGAGPGDANVAELLIREMLDCLGVASVHFAGLMNSPTGPPLTDSRMLSQRFFPPPGEFGRRSSTGLRGTMQCIADRLQRYEPAIRKLSREVICFVREAKPDRLWAILSSTAAIDTAYLVQKATGVKMLLHVWDDPRHIMTQRQLDRFTFRRTMGRFNYLLAHAEKLGVICEQMADAYAQESRAPAVVVRHGLKDFVRPISEPSSEDEFRIGLSGSMYCYSAWKALQEAFDRLDWRIGSRRIVLVVAGSEIQFRAFRPAECRFYGWRPLEQVAELLSECDLLYVPHPFESYQEPLARLSFPTKLSAYVATGRPILIHAPEYSSLTSFCRQHQFGLLTHELNSEKLTAFLLRHLSSADRLKKLSEETARVGSTVLGRTQFQHSTLDFLTGPES